MNEICLKHSKLHYLLTENKSFSLCNIKSLKVYYLPLSPQYTLYRLYSIPTFAGHSDSDRVTDRRLSDSLSMSRGHNRNNLLGIERDLIRTDR